MLAYFNAILRILRLEETIYHELSEKGLTLRYCVINVIVLGMLYGLCSLYFNREFFNVFSEGASLLVSQVIILFVGIGMTFFLHAGAGLLIWVFVRGVGGHTNFLNVYFNVGIAVVPLWLAIPGLTALQAGITSPIILPYIGLTGAYSLISLFTAAKSATGLSVLRVSLAMTITVIFITCFLYLWV